MIFGRPTNLIIGAFTALFNVVVLVSNSQGGTFFTPEIVAAVNIAAGAIVTLVAGQPPALKVGDGYTVVTPGTAPNVEKVANAYPTPPANLVPK